MFPCRDAVPDDARFVSRRRTALGRSSTRYRSALGNRLGPGMKLAASALTTDRSENPATDTNTVSTARQGPSAVIPFSPAGASPTGTAGPRERRCQRQFRRGVARMHSPLRRTCAPAQPSLSPRGTHADRHHPPAHQPRSPVPCGPQGPRQPDRRRGSRLTRVEGRLGEGEQGKGRERLRSARQPSSALKKKRA